MQIRSEVFAKSC